MVVLGVELLALLALLGDRRFTLHDKIPVHWSRGSKPNLYAPRRLGLAIFPVIGTVVLLSMAFGREPVFMLVLVQLGLAACNMLYFHAVGRTFAQA